MSNFPNHTNQFRVYFPDVEGQWHGPFTTAASAKEALDEAKADMPDDAGEPVVQELMKSDHENPEEVVAQWEEVTD